MILSKDSHCYPLKNTDQAKYFCIENKQKSKKKMPMLWNWKKITLLLLTVLNKLNPSNPFAMPSGRINVRPHTGIVQQAATTSIDNINSNVLSVASPQLLEFREPKTNVTVVLIGAMHYNPTSVRLTQDVIDDLGKSNKLGSVVIESCDIRWNKTGELYEESPLIEKFLSNEMRMGSDMALTYQRPVILGDQRINITTTALKNGFKQTFVDLTNPINGWKRFANELSGAAKVALPTGPGYLGLFGFLDLRLLLAAPVSFVKYPTSFLFRSPIFTAIFLTLVASSIIDPSSMDGSVGDVSESANLDDLVASIGISILETIVFSRLLIKELLAERNEILAKNILDQCKIYASPVSGSKKPGIQIPFISRWLTSSTNPTSMVSDTVYTEDSLKYLPTTAFLGASGDDNNNEKVVVAVLGMAHCNGIAKLLKEQMI